MPLPGLWIPVLTCHTPKATTTTVLRFSLADLNYMRLISNASERFIQCVQMLPPVRFQSILEKIRYAACDYWEAELCTPNQGIPVTTNTYFVWISFYFDKNTTMRNSFLKGFLILVVALATMESTRSDSDAPKSVVKLLFCRSWSYKGAAVQVRNYLMQHFGSTIQVEMDNYPPTPGNVRVAWTVTAPFWYFSLDIFQ
jgi:hypothetical protein